MHDKQQKRKMNNMVTTTFTDLHTFSSHTHTLQQHVVIGVGVFREGYALGVAVGTRHVHLLQVVADPQRLREPYLHSGSWLLFFHSFCFHALFFRTCTCSGRNEGASTKRRFCVVPEDTITLIMNK